MKNILSTIKSKLQTTVLYFKRHSGVSILLALLVGLGIGILIGKTVLNKETAPKESVSTSTPIPSAFERPADEKARLEDAQKNAQKRIADAEKAGRLTKDQAKKLNEKATEIYNFRKSIDTTTKEGREQLREKRKEWRQWVKDNNVSTVYIMQLYI